MAKLTKEFIEACLDLSDNEHSKLSERERELFGLSSSRLRAFINNICSQDNTSYLEIGAYRGATLLCAVYGNKVAKAVGIDHFKYDEREPTRWAKENTIWENVRSQLYANIDRYKDPDSNVDTSKITIIPQAFEEVEFNKSDRFDVCFFDATPVTEQSYINFFNKILPHLTLESVIIFSNFSNENSSKSLLKVLEQYSDKFTIQHKAQRISSGLSDSTKYYSGILVLSIKKTLKV